MNSFWYFLITKIQNTKQKSGRYYRICAIYIARHFFVHLWMEDRKFTKKFLKWPKHNLELQAQYL